MTELKNTGKSRKRRIPLKKTFHAAQDSRGSHSAQKPSAVTSAWGSCVFFLNGVFSRLTYFGAVLASIQGAYQIYNYARSSQWIAYPASKVLLRFSNRFATPSEGEAETTIYWITSNVSLGLLIMILGVLGFILCQILSPRRL